MGGNRGGRGAWSREADRKWQLWSGAYSPPWHKQQQQDRQAFPTYSGVVADKDVNKPALTGTSRGQGDGYLTQDLQSAVNLTRKAENRVHKLHTAYTTAQEQWVLFEQKSKANFLKEKKRFLADLTRIEKEAWEAEEHQAQCRLAVRNLVLGVGMPSVKVMPIDKAEETVETLFASWVSEDDDAGIMQRALGSAPSTSAITPPRSSLRVPMTPAAPAGQLSGAQVTSDPYLAAGKPPNVTPTSVAQGGPSDLVEPPGFSPQAPKHPGQRDKDAPRVPTGDAPPRENIKDATKVRATTPRQHVTLEAKLQARRQQEMERTQALRPFGVGNVPTFTLFGQDAPSVEQTGMAKLAKATFEDDDPDNDAIMPPGFGDLE